MAKKDNHKDKKELIVIGAGPGGYRAAFMAADLGMDVTLIDKEEKPGGECLYRGCIPTKALLHAVKLKEAATAASPMGISFAEPGLDIKKMAHWKQGVIDRLTDGLAGLVKGREIEYLRGTAKFSSDSTVVFEDTDGNTRELTFSQAIIATGATPVKLKGLEPDGDRIMGSEAALELKEIPQKLLVVGGGYIGLEMAHIYHGLGSEVSVAELTDGFMPGTDRDLVKEYNRSAKKIYKEIFLETSVKEVKKNKTNLRVTFEGKEGTFSNSYDRILVAVGEKPDHGKLDLDKTGVATDDAGFIKVDEQQRTSVQHIFAVGDVAGGPLLAHKAMYEGKIAAEVAAGKDVVNDARVIPGVVYTEPEIAFCGLTEIEAKEKGRSYEKVKFPWAASGRAVAMHEKLGFTKLLIDSENERILGAGIVGKDAGDLISEIALAIEMGATATDLALTIHPHPTLSE
ncbi:MAG: dihydrolipoyl dehydrogenase, partial [Bacteroidales bacterium]|nr:dihydrolipoyl dehydrogenase [Bacteroidales bacterium]